MAKITDQGMFEYEIGGRKKSINLKKVVGISWRPFSGFDQTLVFIRGNGSRTELDGYLIFDCMDIQSRWLRLLSGGIHGINLTPKFHESRVH